MLVPFTELMQRPDVVALAQRTFSADGVPDWIARFMALTMACSPCNPDDELLDGYAGAGVCVFYAPALGPDDEPGPNYEPWTCAVNLGASLSFVFVPAGYPSGSPFYTADDSWHVPEGRAPGREDLRWPEDLHALLERSHWLVVRPPEGLQLS